MGRGVAAMAAHDAGARVLLLEKQPDPGGISVCSAGGVRIARDPGAAFEYLTATNAATTPAPVLRAERRMRDIGCLPRWRKHGWAWGTSRNRMLIWLKQRQSLLRRPPG